MKMLKSQFPSTATNSPMCRSTDVVLTVLGASDQEQAALSRVLVYREY